jgi:hypothetical protein
MRNQYHGTDQVHMMSGSGMSISNIGHSIISTPSGNCVFKNNLHVPQATKNRVSVH